jgi:hypothetical protein
MKRIAFAAVAVGIALLVGAGAYLLWSLDARVARAIEEQGTRIVGTRVRVDSVHIELAAGRGTIRGVRIANPEGFSAADAISLAEIELAIDARSLRERPFRITQVRVGDSVVHFEISEDGASNIGRITRNVARSSGERAGGPAPRGQPMRFAIGEFAFAGGEIFLARPGAVDRERVHLPDLALRDLGGANGATGGEIGEQIARAFMRRVIATTAGHQLGRAVEKELGEAAGDVAESILRNVLD